MYRFRRVITPKSFLAICFLIILIRLLPFYDKFVDTIFHRTQINFDTENIVFSNNKIRSVSFNHSKKLISWNKNLCVWFNFFQAQNTVFTEDDPTLCLHGTINYAPLLFEHLQQWPSFISFALYVDEFSDLEALKLYTSFLKCHQKASSFASIHLVFENQNCSSISITTNFDAWNTLVDCNEMNEKYSKVLYIFNRYSQNLYPINSLRNIARKGAVTKFYVNSDIENIFSFNAHLILKTISQKMDKLDKQRPAIIIRRFEVPIDSPIPQNINQLVTAINNKKAFLFHHQFYGSAHVIPYLEHWLTESSKRSDTFIRSLNHSNIHAWEPLTAIRDSFPHYFEGLLYRYRNQLSYSYELCRANYAFVVASHIFTIHKGIKQRLTRSEKFSLQGNWNEARRSWFQFMRVMKAKYPQTKQKCQTKLN